MQCIDVDSIISGGICTFKFDVYIVKFKTS